MQHQTPKGSKWGKVASVVLTTLSIGLFAAGIAYLRTDIPATAAQYDENLRAAKIAGLPLTKDEARALRQVPESENAASLVINIPEPGADVTGITSDFQSFDGKWKTLEPFVPRLLAASHKKYLMFPESPYNPSEIAPNAQFRLAQWILVLCWRADVAAKASDPAMASELLLASSKLTCLMDQDPDFRLQSLRASMASAVDVELARLITEYGDDATFQQIISHCLEILDKPYDFRPAYKYGHWMDLQRVLVCSGELPDPTGESQPLGERYIPRYEKANKSRVHQMYAAMVNSYPSDIRDYAKVESLNDQSFSPFDEPSMSTSAFGYPIYEYSKTIHEIRGEVAKRRALAVALAIKRKQSGAASASKDLGPMGLDIDGMPIRTKKLPKGWIVFSVGTNMKDDGGQERRFFAPDWVVHLTPETVPVSQPKGGTHR